MDQFFVDYLDRLSDLHAAYKKYIADLPDEALDWLPGEEMSTLNSLVAHVTGAEAYWLGELMNGVPANRVRAEEFATHGWSVAEALGRLDRATHNARDWVGRLSLADFPRVLVIPNREGNYTLGWWLLHTLDHTAEHLGHAGMTRQLWQRRAG
jgi:uncharacterized damage-inducible protein DinB